MAKRLPIPIREILGEPFDEAALEAARQRVRLAPRPRAPVRAALVMGVGLASVGAVAAVVRYTFTAPVSGPVRLASGAELSALRGGAVSRDYALDDGSHVELAPGASVEALANDSSELVLLERGTATFDVQPGGSRRWTIECGLATVVVVGTRFTIEQSARQLRVSVARGAVLVRGERVPERARRLGAGDEIVIDAEEPTPSARLRAPIDVQSPVPSNDAHSPVASSTAAAEHRVSATRSATWRTLAASGAWERAYAELGAAGIVHAAQRASVDELLELADVARLSGHPSDAVAPLERIVDSYPHDANAPLAAFSLGRVASDQLHQPARAARAFEQALALGLPAALRPDALSRLARAHGAAANGAEASRAASRYLADYPDGPQSAAMQVLAGATQ